MIEIPAYRLNTIIQRVMEAARTTSRLRWTARSSTTINGTRAVVVGMCHLPRKPNTGIDIGIQDINDEVQHDDHYPSHQYHTLDHRKISIGQTVVEQLTHARPVEDDFDWTRLFLHLASGDSHTSRGRISHGKIPHLREGD
jgi:hypothetical protein